MTSTSTDGLESLSEEIKCYNLPYGALGFASHVLTYYTIVCLWFGRKPLWPFSRVSYSWFDLALGGIGLLISTLLSIVTIVRCKNSWELLVIGVWKMAMSLLNGITAIHVACMVILQKRRMKRRRREATGSSSDGDAVGDEAQVEKSDGSAVVAGDEPGVGVRDGSDRDRDVEQEAAVPIKVVLNPMRWVSWWVVLCEFDRTSPICYSLTVCGRHSRNVCRGRWPHGIGGQRPQETPRSLEAHCGVLCGRRCRHSHRCGGSGVPPPKRGGWTNSPKTRVWRPDMDGRNVQRPRGLLL